MIRRPARQEPPCPRTFTVVLTDPRLYVIDKVNAPPGAIAGASA